MNFPRLLRNTCSILWLAATPALAQYTLKKIIFEGGAPYTQASLEAASGLKPGDKLTNETMQQAAQQLSDTGAFGDLQVTLDGPIKAVSIIFKIKPLDPAHQLTVSFDNLIWFTPEELDAGLRSRVPLFDPQLPEAGNLQDAVQTALSEMLKEKGINATVDHEIFDPSARHPMRIVAYRVETPSVRVHEINLTGVSPEFVNAIRSIRAKVVGTTFNEGIEKPTTADVLLRPYLEAGYLNAHLVGRKLMPVASSPDHVDVDLSASVDPGAPFRIGTVTWAGSPQMSSAAFAAASPLHGGDLATPATLDKTVDLLAAAYRKQGYADVTVSPNPSLDTAANRVSYTFSVVSGEVYRIRTLTPFNLTPAQQADFNRVWELKAGDIFNSEYIADFLQQNRSLHSFDGYSASFKATRDTDSHLVDVTVIFSRGLTQ